jgi:hypothetical protein
MTDTSESATAEADPLARTAATRRVGLALAMIVAPWLIVIAETANALTNPLGKDDISDNAAGLALTAAHLTTVQWASFVGMIGSILLVPAVLGVMDLVRTRAARLGLVGGVLTALGYICYFGLVFQGAGTEVAMVTTGGSTAQNVAVLDQFMEQPMTAWAGPVFVLGNIVGTFLLGLALVRARTTARAAGYGLMAWPVLHLLSFSPFVEVVAALAQAAGLALAAIALLGGAGSAHRKKPQPYELLRR